MLVKSTDQIRLTNTPAADLDVVAAYVDYTDGASTAVPDRPTSQLFTTAQTNAVIITSSGGGTVKRNPNWISIRNRDTVDSTAVTLNHYDGTISAELIKVTLLPGEELVLNRGVWFHYDANLAVIASSAPLASDTAAGVIEIAIQSEMETGTDVVRAVTPGRQHFHPSACKAWLKCGVTANLLASYNITSLTDTGTGDVAVTIATDFSSGNYSVSATIEKVDTVGTVAQARDVKIKSGTLAAGTFSLQCWDKTATTNLIKDPTTWHACCFGDL